MNLQEWMSNRKEVLDQIPLGGRGNRDSIEMLGFPLTVKEDYSVLNSQICENVKLTKRTVLQQKVSVFDPLGRYSPVNLKGKMFYNNYKTGNFPRINIYLQMSEHNGTVSDKTSNNYLLVILQDILAHMRK